MSRTPRRDPHPRDSPTSPSAPTNSASSPPRGPGRSPNLTGQRLADARAALKQAGLVAATAAGGTVGVETAQDASPGTRIESCTTIILTIQPTDEPRPAPAEHRIALTVTKSLSDGDVRSAV